ncbi:type VI secretion protein [Caballeronia pedi]|uniref:Type VI secretion protein n=1 Tax=Caballeronia pedi TaxID=1777141 RepID=A0A157ZVC6_9BURK|nr:type VI secretion system baseplate subunit TssG [Caballeronia pedi]SAK49461.1 type VI secretion protein [Caballeronia pedi]
MERLPVASLLRDPPLSPETFSRLESEPWRYGFLSLMRRIGANAGIAPIGTAQRPSAEPFRLGQYPSLTFAPREIASAGAHDGHLQIRLFGLGMLGPNGPLPLHVTEIARERQEWRRDKTLVDFLDIFHHRYLTLLYRAWSSAQAAAGLDRPGDEPFSLYVASIIGQDTNEICRRTLPAHAQLAAASSLVREARDPDGLRMTLEHYFGVPVNIVEYVFHWIEVAAEEHTHLGRAGPAATMGVGALLGEQVPDRQYRFRIVVGPIDMDRYLRFTPRGDDLPMLVDLVRSFVGREFEWELELRIRAESASAAMVGGPQQLGWSGWLGHSPEGQAVAGMCFEPEQYVDQFSRRTREERAVHASAGGGAR